MIEITEAHVEALARRLADENEHLSADDLVYFAKDIEDEDMGDKVETCTPLGRVVHFCPTPQPFWHYYRDEARTALNWLREGGG